MKIIISIFLCFTVLAGIAQQSDSHQKLVVKQKILTSAEVKEWQSAMITHQKSEMEFCALKAKQHKIEKNSLSVSHSKPSEYTALENLILKLFRKMRITQELKEQVTAKERVMRQSHPEIATHFKLDEIFPELYAPVSKARRENIKKLLSVRAESRTSL